MSGKAIRETLAALGVIASMVFVGWEIRQNTAVARVDAYHAIMADQGQLADMLATDPLLTPLMARIGGGALPEEFDQLERFRIRVFERRNLRSWEGLFLATTEGVLPREKLDIIGAAGAFEAPYLRREWENIRVGFDPDFLAFVEERFDLAP